LLFFWDWWVWFTEGSGRKKQHALNPIKKESFMVTSTPHRPLVAAGMLLGIGMGGFFDGILFHQILQIHNMLSAKRPPTTVVDIEINMFWDGLFHALTYTMTALGIAMLWRAVPTIRPPWPTKTLVGSMLLGFGVFNTVEGTIDHLILHVHHVVERLGLSVFDWLFLGSGILLALVGWRLISLDSQKIAADPSHFSGFHKPPSSAW
jgi:uncharacterized membrane protein